MKSYRKEPRQRTCLGRLPIRNINDLNPFQRRTLEPWVEHGFTLRGLEEYPDGKVGGIISRFVTYHRYNLKLEEGVISELTDEMRSLLYMVQHFKPGFEQASRTDRKYRNHGRALWTDIQIYETYTITVSTTGEITYLSYWDGTSYWRYPACHTWEYLHWGEQRVFHESNRVQLWQKLDCSIAEVKQSEYQRIIRKDLVRYGDYPV
jgi:hypothetical protein